MCCNGKSTLIEASFSTNTITQDMNTCAGVDVGLLTLFKRKVDCAVAGNLADTIGVTQASLTGGQTILANWIAAKEIEPATCDYYEYLPLVQNLVAKMIAKGICI